MSVISMVFPVLWILPQEHEWKTLTMRLGHADQCTCCIWSNMNPLLLRRQLLLTIFCIQMCNTAELVHQTAISRWRHCHVVNTEGWDYYTLYRILIYDFMAGLKYILLLLLLYYNTVLVQVLVLLVQCPVKNLVELGAKWKAHNRLRTGAI